MHTLQIGAALKVILKMSPSYSKRDPAGPLGTSIEGGIGEHGRTPWESRRRSD